MRRASSNPPPPDTLARDPSSWRPLFVPKTLGSKVRSGPTRTSEVPPPLEGSVPEQVPGIPAVPSSGRIARLPSALGLSVALLLVSLAVLLLRR